MAKIRKKQLSSVVLQQEKQAGDLLKDFGTLEDSDSLISLQQHFQPRPESPSDAGEKRLALTSSPSHQPSDMEQSSDSDSDSEDEEKGLGTIKSGTNLESLSKKQRKVLARPSPAQLKMKVDRADLVEFWDTTAPDPVLLVSLKSVRNSVPVPRHWSEKKKFLQGKRGIEKLPFMIPKYITETGVVGLREATLKEFEKGLKTRMKQRLDPKTHRFEVDYEVLHDAFFKYQTKPTLSSFGELYYEGKEYEVHLLKCKPGKLSTRLRRALGIAPNGPPPWLVNQQRHGPPPSYPLLKIPGLNAPIPPGAKYGYHPSGWGKIPVDINGRGLYGDVFAEQVEEEEVQEKKLWGSFQFSEGSLVSETLEAAGTITVQTIREKQEEEKMMGELVEGVEYETPGRHGGVIDMT
ncbi:hypothetical protein GEMRC1_008846 [Eukaryota sp. GEM-RC1]